MTGQFCRFARQDCACPTPCRHDGRCEARIETIDAVRYIDSLPIDEAGEYQRHPNSVIRAAASWRCQPWRFGPWSSTLVSVDPDAEKGGA